MVWAETYTELKFMTKKCNLKWTIYIYIVEYH